MQIYPVIELPQQPIKIKHAPQDDQYLPYLMIGAVALSSMNFIWITLLAIVNWYAYIHLFTHPYVGTVLFFGLMTFIMLVSVCLLVLSLCMQCNGVIKYTMVDDLIIALYTVLGLLVFGGATILVMSLKTLSWRVNTSIILSLFYPISACSLLLYLLYQIPVQKPIEFQQVNKSESDK